jgi:hypothetical protein
MIGKPNSEEGIMSWDDLMDESPLEVTKPNVEEEITTQEIPSTEEEEEEVETTVETVEEQEEEEKPEPKKAKENTNSGNSSFTNITKKYIENGKWDDVVLEIDGEEVQLSELEDLDEDTFFQIQDAQEKLKEEERSEKFINKEGLNETSLKLIELQKNGGDISEAFRVYNEYVNPLEGLDLNNERIQEHLVRKSLERKVDDPDVINYTIEKYKKDLVLDKKAKEVVDFTNQAFDTYIQQKNTEAKDKKTEEVEAHKTYLNTLKEQYKDVDLKPALKNKFLQLANRDDKGEIEAINLVREQLKDPAQAKELLYFIAEREAYKKSIGIESKKTTNLDTFKKINIIKDRQKKQSGTTKKVEKDVADFNFFEI